MIQIKWEFHKKTKPMKHKWSNYKNCYKHRSRHLSILTTRTVTNTGVNISPFHYNVALRWRCGTLINTFCVKTKTTH